MMLACGTSAIVNSMYWSPFQKYVAKASSAALGVVAYDARFCKAAVPRVLFAPCADCGCSSALFEMPLLRSDAAVSLRRQIAVPNVTSRHKTTIALNARRRT